MNSSLGKKKDEKQQTSVIGSGSTKGQSERDFKT